MFFSFSCPISPLIIFNDSGDGTRGQLARPAAAAGGGVGAERTEGHRGANQPRGETHTHVRKKHEFSERLKLELDRLD